MRLLFAAAVLAGFVGCAGTPVTKPTEIEIAGKVVLPDGTTLQKGVISFEPAEGGVAREEWTKIENGKFATKVFCSKYRVVIDKADLRGSAKTSVPGKYTSGTTSDVIVDLTAPNPDLTISLK